MLDLTRWTKLVVKKYLETLKWEILPHPRSMAHGLADQHLSSYEEEKNWIDSWILSKDEKSYRRGIRQLPDRWAKVVANDGQ
nr:Mariner Mos1 transposase [Hymenolepis microstoma]